MFAPSDSEIRNTTHTAAHLLSGAAIRAAELAQSTHSEADQADAESLLLVAEHTLSLAQRWSDRWGQDNPLFPDSNLAIWGRQLAEVRNR